MGTSVGTRVFTEYGWRAGAALSMGWTGWQLFILLIRGPNCAQYTWIGWEGGFGMVRKRRADIESKPAVGVVEDKEDPVKEKRTTA